MIKHGVRETYISLKGMLVLSGPLMSQTTLSPCGNPGPRADFRDSCFVFMSNLLLPNWRSRPHDRTFFSLMQIPPRSSFIKWSAQRRYPKTWTLPRMRLRVPGTLHCWLSTPATQEVLDHVHTMDTSITGLLQLSCLLVSAFSDNIVLSPSFLTIFCLLHGLPC